MTSSQKPEKSPPPSGRPETYSLLGSPRAVTSSVSVFALKLHLAVKFSGVAEPLDVSAR